ncbi:MAG: ice-binding family protein [Candidatus Colwellbacteria bacterium]
MKTKAINVWQILGVSAVILAGATYVYAASPTTVDLGTADDFAILAGSGITNVPTSAIVGDVGSDPTVSNGLTNAEVTGTNYTASSPVVQQAKTDLVTAYNDAAGRTPVSTVPTELGGTTQVPGVYDSADGTFGITGTLTLDAGGDPNAVFIFKTASTLITAGASNVVLTGDAQACNVFWQVGSSATLDTSSNFKGNILALTSITDNGGSTIDGRLLARNGAVTLNQTHVTKQTCATSPESAPESAIVVKKETNSSGNETFEFQVTGEGWSDFTLGHGEEQSFNLEAGTYSVVEVNLPGLWELDSASCIGSEGEEDPLALDLQHEETIICTFTNSEDSGGGGDSTLDEPESERLGEQVEIVPQVAPATGTGGVSTNALYGLLLTLAGLYGFARLRKEQI